MTKVLIVDDEVLVRVGIKSLVDWEKQGYEVVADASDGKEALLRIEKYQPDIVLTDLMMEPMDGFQLIAECEKRGYPIKFIVLSNYNDFENVRKAMKLGAFDYIFKLTVKSNELIKILDDANREVLKTNPGGGTSNVILKNMDAIKTSILDKILDNNPYITESIHSDLNSIPLAINLNKKCASIYIAIDNFEIARKKGNFTDLNLLKFTMSNIITELMNQVGNSEIFIYKEKDYYVILNFDIDFKEFTDLIKKQFFILIKYIKQYMGLDISGALSKEYSGVSGLKYAILESKIAMEKRFFYEASNIYLYEPIHNRKLDFSIDDKLQELKEVIVKKNSTQVPASLLNVLRVLDHRESYAPDDIRQLLGKLNKTISNGFSQYTIDTESFLNKDLVNLNEAISGYDFYETIRKNMIVFIDQYIEACETNKGKPCRKEINLVKSFVKSHLNEELSVFKMSNMINMSESRFSHLFKEEVGISFLEYVNQEKEEAAMELLKNTDMKIGEIADSLGIYNPNYFSALFKKRTGMSPNSYRRKEWNSRI